VFRITSRTAVLAAGRRTVETIEVPYGKSHFTLRVPEKGFEVLSCSELPPGGDHLAEILHTREFRRYADKTTLCIVNDGTRPTKTLDVIEQGGLECQYIVATGAHAPPTEDELIYIFGSEFRQKRILIHDARDSTSKLVGVTTRQTPVKFNRSIFQYKRILIIGSVEPHYFAGFSGGRKGLLPGVSAFETIEKNHSHYFSPGVASLKLKGNPVHEDMVEGVDLLDIPILSLNLVVGKHSEILGAFCGSLEDCLSEAAELASYYYSVDLDQQADMVIACAPFPMDADLYQTQKALVNAARACRIGGKIVLISQCRNGIGPRSFYDLMTAHDTLDDVLAYAKENYRLGHHKAASFAEILLQHQVSIISDLSPEELLPIRMHATTPPDLEQTIAVVGDNGGTILHMPEASLTVPRAPIVAN